jgi:DNA-binding phage protein
MATRTAIEKLAEIAKSQSAESIQQVQFRKQNKDWLVVSQEVALALHYYLRKKSMTPEELAGKAELPLGTLQRILQGNENLTIETICKLQKAIEQKLISVEAPYTPSNSR